MGISRSIYLGPYVVCKKGRADVMEITREALCSVDVNRAGAYAIPNVGRKGAPPGVVRFSMNCPILPTEVTV